MKNKSEKTPYRPTLVECQLIEVTDPAEFAALERRVRAAEKAMAGKAETKKAKPRKPK